MAERKSPEEANISAWLTCKAKADAKLERAMTRIQLAREKLDAAEGVAREEHSRGMKFAEHEGRLAGWRVESRGR